MISRTTYHEHAAIELKTDCFRLVAPLAYGPRVMHFASKDGSNLLIELKDEKGLGPNGDFLLRGGHRLWHAPEDTERTYQPDNDPVEMNLLPGKHGFILRQQTEGKTGIKKTVQIEATGPRAVKVGHELKNEGLWPIACAPWGLTMFKGGGRAVIPLLPKGEHPRDLLPNYSLVSWPYTDFSSGGWSFAPSFIGINTKEVRSPQKIGITGYPGWLAYWLNGDAFIKAAPLAPEALYPDSGSKAEIFSNGEMIELETLGPLAPLQPGESCHHHEYWGVLPNLPEPVDEATVRDQWLPAIEEWRGALPTDGGARP